MEQAYIKRTITFYIPTQVGDRFLNKSEFYFEEIKSGEKFIVEEKIPDNTFTIPNYPGSTASIIKEK